MSLSISSNSIELKSLKLQPAWNRRLSAWVMWRSFVRSSRSPRKNAGSQRTWRTCAHASLRFIWSLRSLSEAIHGFLCFRRTSEFAAGMFRYQLTIMNHRVISFKWESVHRIARSSQSARSRRPRLPKRDSLDAANRRFAHDHC